LIVLYFTFVRGMFSSGSTTTVTVKATNTPKPPAVPINPRDFVLPSPDEQELVNTSTAIDYRPGNFYAPDPGRNIFAFYEPPPPCTVDCPTPLPKPIIIPTTPTPPEPDMLVAFLQPQSVYAGSKGFRLEVAGDRFTPDARIYFSQTEVPTTFISGQKLIADIPAHLINGEGPRQIILQTPDGKLHSNQIMLQVQAPPTPQFKYIGMIARKRSNNDTAYFEESGKPTTPISARLNDVVMGRFRLLSISDKEVILEDIGLGFKHKLAMTMPVPGTASSSPPTRGGFPQGRENYVPFTPTIQTNPNSNTNMMSVPGIPDNIPRYTPPRRPPSANKQNADDEDDDGDN